MNGENRLVYNQPIEFEKQPVEVQDFRKITNHFRGIYRIYPNLTERCQIVTGWTWKHFGSRPTMVKHLPGHWYICRAL